MTKDTVGSRIQRIRETRGFTASELARLVGVTPTAVWNWEKNGVQPRSEMLGSIAKVMGVSQEWLLTGEVDGPSADDEARTPASIIEGARIEIARVTGFALDSVSIEVRFSSR